MITNPSDFYTELKKFFPFKPTFKQDKVLGGFSEFIFEKNNNTIFLLKGFAGTGKTSIIATVVSNLWKVKKSAVLLAPTGRAAKVISNYSKTEAFTIHKRIYFPKKEKSGGVKFVMQPNKHRNTIFIVDEASMIPDTPAESKFFENGSLLDDLVRYVFSGFQCKLVFIGDTAQLPPVNSI
ncbi:AAA family ATPase, partial [Paucihalobacter sp.]|uniref:AAA family ATPase n=1 Tax=Paucihalobacter sp. TaxID=2850405 RepID=UPI003D160779